MHVHVGAVLGKLSCFADQYSCPINANPDRYTDTAPSHADGHANTDKYTGTFANIYAGAIRLPKAAGGLHSH
jgi:hypothetical protein